MCSFSLLSSRAILLNQLRNEGGTFVRWTCKFVVVKSNKAASLVRLCVFAAFTSSCACVCMCRRRCRQWHWLIPPVASSAVRKFAHVCLPVTGQKATNRPRGQCDSLRCWKPSGRVEPGWGRGEKGKEKLQSTYATQQEINTFYSPSLLSLTLAPSADERLVILGWGPAPNSQ